MYLSDKKYKYDSVKYKPTDDTNKDSEKHNMDLTSLDDLPLPGVAGSLDFSASMEASDESVTTSTRMGSSGVRLERFFDLCGLTNPMHDFTSNK